MYSINKEEAIFESASEFEEDLIEADTDPTTNSFGNYPTNI